MALFLMSLSVLRRYLSMPSINGAPGETRTPSHGLQNRCFTIKLIGRKTIYHLSLAVPGGNDPPLLA